MCGISDGITAAATRTFVRSSILLKIWGEWSFGYLVLQVTVGSKRDCYVRGLERDKLVFLLDWLFEGKHGGWGV